MWEIFHKKRYLADYLGGFVDMHNHILPGIDDGAKTVEDSLKLIRGFQELGINRFIATPHIMQDYYPNTPATIKSSRNLLANQLLANKMIDVVLEAAAEHMLDSNFENLLKEGEVMPVRNKYLLVEMSFYQETRNVETDLAAVFDAGYIPIMAHPERYSYLHTDLKNYEVYKRNGVLFQVNLLSLAGQYGKRIQEKAKELAEAGYVDFLGSDVHHVQQLDVIKETKLSREELSLYLPLLEQTIANFY
ncbi:tyrosine-protein phosphatase [Lentiprolixibacter aurantiacus]|uniref:protein-tyrosine-phosphatase n=1 Tax=Lentiprolixibacter aurantiacus TaxID=2993939 RepID=A0AAE3MLV5_9FLAO|nr:CpsB/CapC family capsule biosynthesis tyrosine phosphatase [Lentiprolixibacter aurantiacus]MCX2719839.1 histidinol phosphatase [Lentiprolixibacter aurantiacus]